MKKYLKKRSEKPTFTQKGLKGYKFDLSSSSLEIYEVDAEQGHDTYIISKKITHIYYVLEGTGKFDIDGEKVEVKMGDLVEVLSNVEYTYSGKMKVMLIMTPPWFEGNEIITKQNKDVK